MSLSTSEILKPLKKNSRREVLDVKALGFALIIHFRSFFKQYKPLTNQRALH